MNISPTSSKFGFWKCYRSKGAPAKSPKTVGKWTYQFSDERAAMRICEEALQEGVCLECRCTDISKTKMPTGVVCFYVNGDDVEEHRRVIDFMLAHGLIQKTSAGNYCDLVFKFDDATCIQSRDKNLARRVRLADFVDLTSGEWLEEPGSVVKALFPKEKSHA